MAIFSEQILFNIHLLYICFLQKIMFFFQNTLFNLKNVWILITYLGNWNSKFRVRWPPADPTWSKVSRTWETFVWTSSGTSPRGCLLSQEFYPRIFARLPKRYKIYGSNVTMNNDDIIWECVSNAFIRSNWPKEKFL